MAYLVSTCSARLTSAAENARLHSYTVTRSDIAHAATDFRPSEIPQSRDVKKRKRIYL